MKNILGINCPRWKCFKGVLLKEVFVINRTGSCAEMKISNWQYFPSRIFIYPNRRSIQIIHLGGVLALSKNP